MLIMAWFLGRALKDLKRNSDMYLSKRSHRLDTVKSTYFLDEGKCDNICGICFGEFEEYTLCQCKCGKVFHTDCMEMTQQCPYCKTEAPMMQTRPVRKPLCPACGKPIKDNICECGTVLPNKDKTFKCICGATILIYDEECPKCGSKYAPFYKI